MTGLDALRNGATSVTAGRTFLRLGLPTLPGLLGAAGYRTGLFGKWHLGDHYPHRPIDRGFHESIYHLSWGMLYPAPELGNPLIDGRYFHNGAPKRFRGHCTDFWFESATAFMREQARKREPFFCYLATNAPHAPYIELEEFVKPYRGRGPAGFFGMISHVDRNFGRLEAFLRELGLRDNTLVIFMTDNGGTAGVKVHNAGLRAGKTTLYDGGHRVPCWMRWPAGKLGLPRDISGPAQVQDVLPTVLDLCGVARPAGHRFDGLSLAGILRRTEKALPERMMVVQYGQIIRKWDSCVIGGKWRLVKGEELYDVEADRAQKHDVAKDNPAVVKRMRAHYEAWWAGVAPRVNDFVPISLGAAQQPVVSLTSADWEGLYADNYLHVATGVGGPRGGNWHVQVEKAGEYELVLRRWPRESKAALGARLDRIAGGPKEVESKAFPIAAARVEAAGKSATAKTAPTEQEVTVRLTLPAGRTILKAWFQDERGNDLCGAFFAYVRRRE
jgi:arylsulfatase